ncbi:MAG: type II toxin-antitoxin system PemK/MazF family toxin [candidate division WOR-3 bacterium]|nr:type II toxin-antitoxin system PemK/MazF family toxin [candidate division WOR-3 bacterium]
MTELRPGNSGRVPSPRRGEVWLVNFNPGRGSEQKGVRPALVVQNNVGNQYAATTIVAAITTTIKPYPVTVVIQARTCGLPRDSMVNMAQVLTVDKGRLIRMLGELAPEQLAAANRALRVSLDLT